jgi:hypothetical protein
VTRRLTQSIEGPFPLPWAVVLGMLALVFAGCTRERYRLRADRDVYGLLKPRSCGPGWKLDDYRIDPNPHSRLFDPFNPDRPPMPPDDPASSEFMKCVDGMRGWPHWDRYGKVPAVEICGWKQYLPVDKQGQFSLDRNSAVVVGRLHSRDYQTALETVYLTALDVTLQRFAFDAQYAATNNTYYNLAARIRGTTPTTNSFEDDTSFQVTKLFAAGGQLAAGIANSLVWQLTGPGGEGAVVNTLASFSLVQPLLLGGGRAVVLEPLTANERRLIANVRQMVHFERGFYAMVVTGRSFGTTPVRTGLGITSLSPGVGVAAGGFLGLLSTQVQIRNQRANLAATQYAWRLLDEFYRSQRVTRYQVDLIRQTLFSSQSTLLSLLQSYDTAVDSFLVSLGLPPDLAVKIADPLVEPFDLVSQPMTSLGDEIQAVLDRVRDRAKPLDAGLGGQIAQLDNDCREQFQAVTRDLKAMDDALPLREQDLKGLALRPEVKRGDVEPSAYQVDALRQRVQGVHDEFAPLRPLIPPPRTPPVRERLQELLRQLAPWRQPPPADNPRVATARDHLIDLLVGLLKAVQDMSWLQARARLDTIRLVPVELDSGEAFDIACHHRLDWMNARTALVDVWRQVEVQANALDAGLNLTANGALNNSDNNPLNVHSTYGTLQVGVQFAAPLNRYAARNAYRQALINYQQARRQYLLFTDSIDQGLRNTLRTMQIDQLDFELRRAAVFLAITQVDQARLNLEAPPQPGAANVLGPTAALDLLNALSALLSAENTFLTEWLNYESERISLDWDLGTMVLDHCGIWVDPGPIHGSRKPAGTPSSVEVIPAPAPAPADGAKSHRAGNGSTTGEPVDAPPPPPNH